MHRTSTVIVLGIIQVIILTLLGLYFYRLKHPASPPPPEYNLPAAPERAVSL